MVRFLIRMAIYVVAAAVGLVVAALALDDMELDFTALLYAAIIFAAIQSLLTPWFAKVTHRNAPALLGAVGLVTSFIALVVTTWLTSGLSISGASTWLLAALIVWLVTMVATFVLPFILVKMGVEAARERRAGS